MDEFEDFQDGIPGVMLTESEVAALFEGATFHRERRWNYFVHDLDNEVYRYWGLVFEVWSSSTCRWEIAPILWDYSYIKAVAYGWDA